MCNPQPFFLNLMVLTSARKTVTIDASKVAKASTLQDCTTKIGGGQTLATTNVQNRFVQIFLFYLFFSFVLLELKPFVLKGLTWGKIMKKCQKVPKNVKNYETILPFSCCPLVFP